MTEVDVVKNTTINKTKPIIIVDIDDVISDYASSVVRFARRKYDKNFTHDKMSENWGEMFNITPREWLKSYEQFLIEERFYKDPPIIDGAFGTLDKLKPEFSLVVLTSRPMFMRDDTLKWLGDNFPGIFNETLFANIYDKYNDDGSNLSTLTKHTKAEMCQEIGAAYLIDDQPKHCNGAAKIGVKSLLFGDYSWNRNVEIVDGVVRVADWSKVADYFGV
jgi:5'(3')-deoxyribonucleotidase